MPNDIIPITPAEVIPQQQIENLIYTIRGVQVMLDRDLARLYQVTTGNLNKAVKRNIGRFPERYMFQLTKEEWESLKFQNGISNMDDEHLKFQNGISKSGRGGIRYMPYAFTEGGVTQLSAILRSAIAVEMSIRINDAFHAMRKFIVANAAIFQRLEAVELKQLTTDQKIDKILDQLEEGTLKQKAHIFSAGYIYPSTSSGRAQNYTNNGIYIYTSARQRSILHWYHDQFAA